MASIVVVGFIPQLQSLKASSSPPFAEGGIGGGGGGIGISVPPTGLSIIQLTSSVISLFAGGAIIGRLVYGGDPWAGLIHSSALVAYPSRCTWPLPSRQACSREDRSKASYP